MIPASPISAHIGEVVRERRIELGLTQEQLAQKIGTYRTLVARLENGRRHTPTLDTLFAYAEALRIEPEEVIRRARQMAGQPGQPCPVCEGFGRCKRGWQHEVCPVCEGDGVARRE